MGRRYSPKISLFRLRIPFSKRCRFLHPDNYIPANPMSTPAHIVPEWYFLWVYAILRSIPNKLGGVAAIALVFIALLALPFINTASTRSSSFRPLHKKFFWLLVADCIILVWIGLEPVEDPYVLIGQLASVYFFIYFLILIPFLGIFEQHLIKYVKGDIKNVTAA